jgi:hypothetical protein
VAAEAVAVAVAAAVVAAAAVCRGALAAFARPDYFGIALTNAGLHGRVRLGRPGHFMSSLQFSSLQFMSSLQQNDSLSRQ